MPRRRRPPASAPERRQPRPQPPQGRANAPPPAQQKVAPCRLSFLTRSLLLRVLSYLDEDDRASGLGAIGVAPRTANKQGQGRQAGAAPPKVGASGPGDERNRNGAERSDAPPGRAENGDDRTESNAGSDDGPKASSSADDRKDATSSSRPTPRRSPPFVAPPDPDTLLARLNTRRLCKRILHGKKNSKEDGKEGGGDTDSNSNPSSCYPKNKTVEQIAMDEWTDLIKKRRDRGHGPPPPVRPSSHELLLFSPCPRPVTVLASYPRSGNSLVRTLFERTTLRVTGSDMRGGLAKHDLVGEAAVSARKVQFVKTHYPERRGHPAFLARRAVLLVRNPLDAIESFFNLMMTSTHTSTLTDELREKASRVWEDMAPKEMQVWKAFHEFWLSLDMPLLIVRYEDLIKSPAEVMARVVRFVLEIKNMGSFFAGRIDRCIREDQLERLGSYRPRSGGIGRSLSRYPPELLGRMCEGSHGIMDRLGYGDLALNPSKEEFDKLKALPRFGVEFAAGEGGGNDLIVNGGKLVRGAEQVTNWREVKKDLGVVNADRCQCYSCTSRSRT